MNEIDDVRYNIYIDDDDRFVYDDDYSKSIKIEEERTGIISIGVILIVFIYMFILCIYFVRQKYYNDDVDVSTITIDLNRFIVETLFLACFVWQFSTRFRHNL